MPTAPSDLEILVTGGCGYVGTKLTHALLGRGHRVTVLDAMWFGNFLTPHPRLTVIAHDMRQIDAFDLSPFDTIFHLANIANDPAVELNPYASWEVNVLATMLFTVTVVAGLLVLIQQRRAERMTQVRPEPQGAAA